MTIVCAMRIVSVFRWIGNIAKPLHNCHDIKKLPSLVAFLASARSSYITGTTILVDGGLVRSVM